MKRRQLRAFAMGAALASLTIALAAPVLALTHHQDLPLERALGSAAVSLVVRLQAGDAKNPNGPGAVVLDAGRFGYLGSCAACHGASGDGKGLFGRDTYPDASDLTGPVAASRTDAELFWITKYGLAFTAMPSFARAYTDQDLWALVSYIRALQERKATPVVVPPPTAQQLAFADPHGTPAQRGAAVYLAQGCAACHGAAGTAPGELALSGPTEELAIRGGGIGMPRYGADVLPAAQLADLLVFVATLDGRKGSR